MESEKLIIFLRHGQSQGNVANILSSVKDTNPLTETGIAQAKTASKSIGALPKVDMVYTSPVLRTVQTAAIATSGLNVQSVVDDRLGERGMGSLEGMAVPNVPNEEWKFDPAYGLENWDSLKSRMLSFMNDAKGSIILAVSHGDPISAACDIMDLKGERFHVLSCPGNCHFSIIDFAKKKIIATDTASIPTELIVRPSGHP